MIETDFVVKLRFNYKLTNVFQNSVKLLDFPGNPLDKQEIDVSDLNCAGFSSDLYFVVMKNDGSIDIDALFTYFNDVFFKKSIQPMLSETVVFEGLQIQRYYPSKALNAFDSISYNEEGIRPISEKMASKPFCLTFSSPLIKTSKNGYKFVIPGVSSVFKEPQHFAKVKSELEVLARTLEGTIAFGQNDNLALSLVIPTGKSNSPIPFVPMTSCSIAGFSSSYRSRLLFRQSK